MNKTSLLLLLISASLAFAFDEDRWFLGSAGTVVDKQTKTAFLKAACQGGKVEGESCSKCPDFQGSHPDQGPWEIISVVVGHFSSARGEEALIRSNFCAVEGPGFQTRLGFWMLLGKRGGKWTKLEDDSFPPDNCAQKKLRSGREFLICESWQYQRDGEATYRLLTVKLENDRFKSRELFAATDSTAVCQEGTGQKGVVKDIEFRDLNGDGLEDISITATYGSFPMTGRRLDQCTAAFEDRIQTTGKGVKEYPQPRVIKTYKVQFLFDGNTYTPTPESRAAVALFQPQR